MKPEPSYPDLVCSRRWKNALVIGLGVSGVAACRLLRAEGCDVTAIDVSADIGPQATELGDIGVDVLLQARAVPSRPFEVCVASPGVPADSEWLRTVRAYGTPVVSELELGWSRCKCPVVAITGTNGKSTAVKLCAEALTMAGRKAQIAGNYGIPISGVCEASGDLDWMVVEASSFQLEAVSAFKPDVAVLLNIAPDHIDRHGSMAGYIAAKMKIFKNLTRKEKSVIPEINEYSGIAEYISSIAAGRVTFGTTAGSDYRYADGRIVCRVAGSEESVVSVAGSIFENDVMGLTAAAVAATLEACGVSAGFVEAATRSFQPLPHRMQQAAFGKGVRFVDDSKATNMAALAAGVAMCGGSVRLVAGGLLKERDLDFVKQVLSRQVKCVYVIGKASDELERAWRDVVVCRVCGDMETAVECAWSEAEEGDTILLSPGCASFDQFENYAHRGDRFAEISKRLLEGEDK